MSVQLTDVAVVGGGPAGLAMGALLKREGIAFRILEKARQAGGAYTRIHPSIKLLSPAEFCSLPLKPGGWPVPSALVSAGEYLDYLRAYQSELAIPVELGYDVERVVSEPGGGYLVQGRAGDSWRCRTVVLATGMVSFPRPIGFDPLKNPGVDYHEGADWKGLEHYRGKTVLIVGSGTSAVELATLMAGNNPVYLAMNKKLKTFPPKILGIDIHYPLKYLERLPVSWFKKICEGRWSEPAVDTGIHKAVRRRQVIPFRCRYRVEGGRLQFEEAGPAPGPIAVDAVINSAGFRFDTSILPPEVERRRNGTLRTVGNRSVSHPGIFVLGHPCAAGADSQYLRGIAKDTQRVLAQLLAERAARPALPVLG